MRNADQMDARVSVEASAAEGFDLGVQAGFVSSRLVLVHDAFADHTVDDGNGRGQGGCSFRLSTALDRSIDALNEDANHGSLAGILTASFFCLSRAFSSLCTISQEFLHLSALSGGNF